MTTITQAPTRADLDQATAHTAEVMASDASDAEKQAAAEAEAELYDQFPAEPGWSPELESYEAQAEEPEAVAEEPEAVAEEPEAG